MTTTDGYPASDGQPHPDTTSAAGPSRPHWIFTLLAAALPVLFACGGGLLLLILAAVTDRQTQHEFDKAGPFLFVVLGLAAMATALCAVLLVLTALGRRVPAASLIAIACLPWLSGVAGTMIGNQRVMQAVASMGIAAEGAMAAGLEEALIARMLGVLFSGMLLCAVGLAWAVVATGLGAPNRRGSGVLVGIGSSLPMLILAVALLVGLGPAGVVALLTALGALLALGLAGFAAGADPPHGRSAAMAAAAAVAMGLAYFAANTFVHALASARLLDMVATLGPGSLSHILAPVQQLEAASSLRVVGTILALLPVPVLLLWARARAKPYAPSIAGAALCLLVAAAMVGVDGLSQRPSSTMVTEVMADYGPQPHRPELQVVEIADPAQAYTIRPTAAPSPSRVADRVPAAHLYIGADELTLDGEAIPLDRLAIEVEEWHTQPLLLHSGPDVSADRVRELLAELSMHLEIALRRDDTFLVPSCLAPEDLYSEELDPRYLSGLVALGGTGGRTRIPSRVAALTITLARAGTPSDQQMVVVHRSGAGDGQPGAELLGDHQAVLVLARQLLDAEDNRLAELGLDTHPQVPWRYISDVILALAETGASTIYLATDGVPLLQIEPMAARDQEAVPAPEPHFLEPEPIADLAEDDLIFGIPETMPETASAGPVRVGGDVQPPRKVSGPDPAYTENALKARIQGVVILELVVTRDGRASSAKVLKGLPMGLDEQARKAVMQWRFEPATLHGRPVDVIYVVTVKFRLSQRHVGNRFGGVKKEERNGAEAEGRKGEEDTAHGSAPASGHHSSWSATVDRQVRRQRVSRGLAVQPASPAQPPGRAPRRGSLRRPAPLRW